MERFLFGRPSCEKGWSNPEQFDEELTAARKNASNGGKRKKLGSSSLLSKPSSSLSSSAQDGNNGGDGGDTETSREFGTDDIERPFKKARKQQPTEKQSTSSKKSKMLPFEYPLKDKPNDVATTTVPKIKGIVPATGKKWKESDAQPLPSGNPNVTIVKSRIVQQLPLSEDEKEEEEENKKENKKERKAEKFIDILIPDKQKEETSLFEEYGMLEEDGGGGGGDPENETENETETEG